MRLFSPILLLLVVFSSCTREQKLTSDSSGRQGEQRIPQSTLTADITAPPLRVPAGIPEQVICRKPLVIQAYSNERRAGIPVVSFPGELKEHTPGTEDLSFPKQVPAGRYRFRASPPEIVRAKDPYFQDQNPYSFSFYSKLQGLKHDVIRCVFQDRKGNLWAGTEGGGVSKFDGTYFTHYNDSRYLGNKTVSSILEDRSGAMWFGIKDGGVAQFDGKYFTCMAGKEGLADKVSSMYMDRDGYLWFGTLGEGAFRYDGILVDALDSGGIIPAPVRSTLRKNGGKYEKTLTRFSEQEGLLNKNVNCIFQDMDGYLWFGTDSGVCRYGQGNGAKDIKTFIHLSAREGLHHGVFSILQDHNGFLWFGTNGGGLFRYDSPVVERMERGEKIPPEVAQQLFFHNGRYTPALICYTTQEGLGNNRVFSLFEDRDQALWLGTDQGAVKFMADRPGGNPSTFTYFTGEQGLSNSSIYSILEDRHGNMWFGTYGKGLAKFSGRLFTHFSEKEGLLNTRIIGLLQDRKGNLWLGSYGGGVARYDGHTYTHFTEKDGLANNRVLSILEDHRGNIWFGTYGGGVSEFNGRTFRTFTTREGLSSDTINFMIEDHLGNLWLATQGGGVSMFADSRNTKNAVPGDTSCFLHFGIAQGLGSNTVYGLLEDRNGNLWFGTDVGGVCRYDGNSMQRFTEKEGLGSNYVVYILEDKSGDLWFCTLGGGISRYDGNRNTGTTFRQNPSLSGQNRETGIISSLNHLSCFTEKDGLSNNYVFSALQDRNGDLWFGTRFGLSKLRWKLLDNYIANRSSGPDELKKTDDRSEQALFRNFTYDDGFLGVGCNRSTLLEDRDGTLWIGANDRFTAYHPGVDQVDSIPPGVEITSLELFNEYIPWTILDQHKDSSLILGNGVSLDHYRFDGISSWQELPINLSLKHTNNFLSFSFIGITLKQSNKTKYQYILEGLDEHWSSPDLSNTASYGNLPSGSYTFRVKAINSDGYVSAAVSYSFTIRPPWWSTWLFRITMVLFMVAGLMGLYSWRIRNMKHRHIQLEKLVASKTAEVVRQKEELQALNHELITTNDALSRERIKLEEALLNLRKAQKKLIQSEKLASIGTLAAGVAHEINNPLNFINGGIQGIESFLNENLKKQTEPLLPLIDAIKTGVTRASAIVKSLNRFSRQTESDKERCDLHSIIENCLVVLRHEVNSRTEIRKSFTSEPYSFTGNEGKMHQVILNLLTNAIQAIGDAGTITITTSVHGSQFTIVIQDTGPGIKEDVLTKIFDPFFTTKEPGKGTGLGLFICYQIIQEYNGTIEIMSEAGVGTTASISLPVTNTVDHKV
jgi:signal transduction histidine kinase/ligand-binding sensor domain-containing protein